MICLHFVFFFLLSPFLSLPISFGQSISFWFWCGEMMILPCAIYLHFHRMQIDFCFAFKWDRQWATAELVSDGHDHRTYYVKYIERDFAYTSTEMNPFNCVVYSISFSFICSFCFVRCISSLVFFSANPQCFWISEHLNEQHAFNFVVMGMHTLPIGINYSVYIISLSFSLSPDLSVQSLHMCVVVC